MTFEVMNLLDPGTLSTLALALSLGAAWSVRAVARRFYVSAQPDEWLLCIRDGALVHAGVGVAMVRRPGDVVVRFSSTMQRVAFALDVLSRERMLVRVEGFIFWSVAPEGDAPFRAYSRLGIANLMRPPPALRHPKHLLTSPQHKAFQQILSAVVQRHASAITLDGLIGRQDELVAGLTERLREVTEEMGVRVDQVEILSTRPADPMVQARLATAEAERIREASERVRREVDERITTAQTEAQTRQAREQAEAQRALRAEQVEREHTLRARELDLERERALAQDAGALDAARRRIGREREETDARLARLRAEAEAERDAELARTEALERKSPAVREHERAVLVAEKVAASLRVTDARWVSIGAQSPAASVGAMIAGVRELLDASPVRPA